MVETIKQIAATVSENLKGQPLLFGLLLINLIFVGGLFYIMKERAADNARQDALLAQLVEKCGK